VAIVNLDDPAVVEWSQRAPGRIVTFGSGEGDYRVSGGRLVGPGGIELASVEALARRLPHDVSNALAAAAAGVEAGADVASVRAVLERFQGLPHRVQLVGDSGGVRWYDDSKATTPASVVAAVSGFDSAVLIAGGRNKGLDLRALADGGEHVHHVVAIGEAGDDVAAAFDGRATVTRAASMDDAVLAAAAAAVPGDVVLLSPGCASFDWYAGYGERGDDFARAVAEHVGTTS
jgi:UDP-N-acetylmuramoylalanine--D-glutamate ligase